MSRYIHQHILSEILRTIPLLQYSMHSLRDCAAAAQASGISQKEVLTAQMDQDLLYNIHDHHWWQLLSTPFMVKARFPFLLELMENEKHFCLAEELITIPSVAQDLDVTCHGYGPPLLEAVRADSLQMISALIWGGASVTPDSMIAAHAICAAARKGSIELVSKLLSLGVMIDAATSHGCTALHAACEYGEETMVLHLLRANTNTCATTSYGDTALHMIVQHMDSGRNNFEHLICALIDAGADINAMSNEGVTPLMLVVASGSAVLTSTLLEHGADISPQNLARENALYLAVEEKNEILVKMLTDAGADVDIPSHIGKNSLH